MQHDRRHNPYPLTWEIPLVVAFAVLLVLVVGVHLGRGVANLAAGAGWLWPDAAWLFRSVPGVLAGDAFAGLRTRSHAATSGSLWVWLGAVESVLVVLLTIAGVAVFRRWGPHRLKGMASPDETERLLGVSRLHRVRRIIRPDLHATEPTIGGRR